VGVSSAQASATLAIAERELLELAEPNDSESPAAVGPIEAWARLRAAVNRE